MNVLVTGGAGFIGSHLVDRLIQEGHRVAVVDDLSHGRRENLNPEADFHEISVVDPGLADVFEKVRPDAVNHHAAQISVSASVEDPIHDARTNVLGSLNLIRCALRFGVRHLVFASTGGALYGDPEYLPCDEEHPIAPLSPYGVAKLAVEKYLYAYHLTHGLTFTCLRYSNVFGPRQDPNGEAGVVAIFCLRMLEGREVEIYGDGTQTRDFVYVGDVVEANLLAHRRHSDVSGLTVNIGTGEETSVNDVFRTLADAAGYDREPVHREKRPGEVYRIALSAEKARTTLRWRPRTDFRDGLEETFEWFRNRSPKP
jgi:UDP-glucose 4-epimerase